MYRHIEKVYRFLKAERKLTRPNLEARNLRLSDHSILDRKPPCWSRKTTHFQTITDRKRFWRPLARSRKIVSPWWSSTTKATFQKSTLDTIPNPILQIKGHILRCPGSFRKWVSSRQLRTEYKKILAMQHWKKRFPIDNAGKNVAIPKITEWVSSRQLKTATEQKKTNGNAKSMFPADNSTPFSKQYTLGPWQVPV